MCVCEQYRECRITVWYDYWEYIRKIIVHMFGHDCIMFLGNYAQYIHVHITLSLSLCVLAF